MLNPIYKKVKKWLMSYHRYIASDDLSHKMKVIKSKNRPLSAKYKVYVYNNWHNGDILFSRPLYEKMIQSGLFDLTMGIYSNNSYLLEDYVSRGVTLHILNQKDDAAGMTADLACMRPEGYIPINTWLGQCTDLRTHTWECAVIVFNKKMLEYGIDFKIEYDPHDIPMIQFPKMDISLKTPAVYIENGETRSRHSIFQFDLKTISEHFPELYFYCSEKPAWNAPNVIDASNFNLKELSDISNQCVAILGKGSGPFLCTYTEPNRYKKRAVCGYDLNGWKPFWVYPNNPLIYLSKMGEVLEFLRGVSNSLKNL